MAQNLFAKYGIKEVADVTLYRIERKDETYESQRKISFSSILKGALSREVVYPLDEDGKGYVEGYEAYVFKNADVLTHFNYDCDDVFDVKGSALFIDNNDPTTAGDEAIAAGDAVTGATRTAIVNYLTTGSDQYHPNLFFAENVSILSLSEASSGRNLRDKTDYLFSHGYGVDTVVVGDGSATGIISAGPTSGDGTVSNITITPVSTYKSEFVAPVTYDNITKAQIIAAVGNNGSLTWDGDTLTAGYITFIATTDARPEEIMGRFQRIQKGLYDSLGVIVRLKQPVKIGNSTETTFSGTILTTVTVADPGVGGTVEMTFDNVILANATQALINSAKADTLRVAQLN